jgi:tetratricopeptide (TPR) repeat protein
LNQLGDYENAIKYFEMEEKTSFSDVSDKINIGISYWGLKEYEKAKYYFEKANKELNKKPKNNNFSSLPKSVNTGLSNRIWLKVMFGNLTSALHSIDGYLRSNDIRLDVFYDLRDWGLVVKRSSDYLPEGFDEFYDRVSKVLLEIDSNSIYELSSGI